MKRSLVAVVLFGAILMMATSGQSARAAPKYALPVLGVKKCAVEQDKGQPTSAKNGNNWNVSTTGKYNYDDAWTFKSLKAEIIYTKGTMTRFGQFNTVTDESTIGTPGSFSFAFWDIEPPGAGEVMVLNVTITVSKTGEEDQKDSHAKDVSPPTEQEEEGIDGAGRVELAIRRTPGETFPFQEGLCARTASSLFGRHSRYWSCCSSSPFLFC